MELQLREFLDARRISAADMHSHTSLVPPGRYYIGEEDIEDFFDLYCRSVAKGIVPTITEKPEQYAPLRIDFDMKASLDSGLKRQYTREMVREVISMYQEELKNAIKEEDYDPKYLKCVLLEKPSPREEKGEVKDGFHIHFPYFICEKWFADYFLKEKILAKLNETKIFDGTTYTTPYKDMVDAIHSKVWLMCGSSKDPAHAKPYKPTAAFDENLDEITFDELFEDEMGGGGVRPHPVEFYIPRFLSIIINTTNSSCTELKEDVIALKEKMFDVKKKRKITIVPKRNMETVEADLALIKAGDIMSMIADSRADNYDEWMDMGWTLFNIGQGCDEALNIWITFSRRSAKFEEGKCEQLWSKMTLQDKTIGSLFAMARKDSPNEYKAWKETQLSSFLYTSLNEPKPSEHDVAVVIHKMYQGRFLCSSQSRNTWYEFVGQRWQYMDGEVTLRKLLSTEVVITYLSLKQKLIEDSKKFQDDVVASARYKLLEKKCDAIITGLKTCDFTNKVIKMCKIEFSCKDFEEKKDENRRLWGCNNCILDLNSGLAREGRPDDYVTFNCGVEYVEFTEEDDEVKETRKFLEMVFPDEELRNYFLDAVCKCLEGGNVDKSFIVHTGDGDNAKSVVFQLLELVFGDYCHKFPRELLVVGKSNSSGSARPELAAVRGKRLAVVQEIAKTETLNIGQLKELTGNDSFFTRGLFKDGCVIKPMFTLMMQCNEPPKIPGNDEATWNRVRVLAYESKFVKEDKLQEFPVARAYKDQLVQKRFKADSHFSQKLPELAQAFLWIIFQRFRKHKESGFVNKQTPQKVMLATTVYRSLNDVYQQFIQERIERIEGLVIDEEYKKSKTAVFLSLNAIHSEYDSWFSQNYKSYAKDKLHKVALGHEMNKKLRYQGLQGRMSGWFGYRIVQDVPEPEDKQKQVLAQLLMSGVKP